jgi:hypothetical protein
MTAAVLAEKVWWERARRRLERGDYDRERADAARSYLAVVATDDGCHPEERRRAVREYMDESSRF